MMLRLSGKEVDYSQLERQLPISEVGTSLTDLADCALAHGLDTTIVRGTSKDLAIGRLPWIAHTESPAEGGHYVLVTDVRPDSVIVFDGTTAARQSIPLAEFQSRWSGYMISPNNEIRWRMGNPAAVILLLGGLLLCIAAWRSFGRRHGAAPRRHFWCCC